MISNLRVSLSRSGYDSSPSIGLVSDEKLVELLEGALKGDSVSTVRCIRQLMEAGTEPLALMSQLATLITDLLAGHTPPLPSSTFISQTLTKVELEKLRQALRILSEAEKQLRSCNNKTTWLTAALLQFSPPESLSHPDSYVQHAARSPSLGTSLTQSPNALLETSEKETADLFLHGANSGSSKPLWRSSHPYEGWHNDVDEAGHESQPVLYPSTVEQAESLEDADIQINIQDKENGLDRPMKQAFSGFNTCYPSPVGQHRDTTMQYRSSVQDIPVCGKKKCSEYHDCNEGVTGTSLSSAEKVWRKLLDGNGRLNILSTQGKLISLSVSEAYAIVHLEFKFPEDMRSARKAILSISEAFGRALGCPVDIRLSLAPSQEKMDDSFITGSNGFYDGPFGCKQVMQRRSRRKKPRKRRLSKMNCTQGGLSVNYYSHPQICCNSSTYYRFHEHSLMDKRNILRSSSSDEDFTPWNQVAELNRSLTRPAHILQKLSPSSTRAISEDYPEYRMNEIAHEKCIQCGFSDSLDEKNNHCESVSNSSRELFHSLRVEKDSLNHSPQSSEDDLEYDQTNMTPSFRTGLLCWKMVGRKSTDKAKGCCQRTTGCVSCAQTD
ncbi:hypothetical protein KP509_23G075900 [Ceratopteris richardii]|uniref:STICHEL DnaA-N-like alpha-beta domain-containing protein n=1 Tax=Ceratopteris richardii TaxID=49495 RepID=A0A8T2S3B3_CERRI|nr:hypothetical protein KP509_23G075900 [Ceratopteris richardii]